MGKTDTKYKKSREWEIFVTFKKFFECLIIDPKYLEKVPLKFLGEF